MEITPRQTKFLFILPLQNLLRISFGEHDFITPQKSLLCVVWHLKTFLWCRCGTYYSNKEGHLHFIAEWTTQLSEHLLSSSSYFFFFIKKKNGPIFVLIVGALFNQKNTNLELILTSKRISMYYWTLNLMTFYLWEIFILYVFYLERNDKTKLSNCQTFVFWYGMYPEYILQIWSNHFIFI